MKVYILETYGYGESIVNQGELTNDDIKSGDSLSEWLNKHIINKYLEYGNGYQYDYNKYADEVFTGVEYPLIAEFKDLLDGKITEFYIYGDLGEYKIFTHINKID